MVKDDDVLKECVVGTGVDPDAPIDSDYNDVHSMKRPYEAADRSDNQVDDAGDIGKGYAVPLCFKTAEQLID